MISRNLSKDKPFHHLPFGWIDMAIVLASFFSGIIFSFLVYFFKAISNIDSISGLLNIDHQILEILFEYFIASIILLTIYWRVILRYRLSWTQFGFHKIPFFRTIGYITIAFVVTFSIWIMIAPLILIFFPSINLEQSQEIFIPNMNIIAQAMLMVYAIIIGPFIEEVVFRGIVLPVISNKTNIFAGIIISTMIWSLLHFQVNVIIFTTIFGIILSYLYLNSRSIWPSYITHVIKNLIAVIAILLLGIY